MQNQDCSVCIFEHGQLLCVPTTLSRVCSYGHARNTYIDNTNTGPEQKKRYLYFPPRFLLTCFVQTCMLLPQLAVVPATRPAPCDLRV